MWHVSSRSGVATLRTAIHLLLTYLPSVIQSDMASDFNFQLTKTFLSMLGCTPLEELRKNFEIVGTYVDSHAKRAQERYVSRYNLRTRDKTFFVGESVLVLTPDSTSSKVFSRWKGPGVVREIK